MNIFDLFEFTEYLTEDDYEKVESIFVTQCLSSEEFTEFKTSLGSNSKAYLSYLIAHSLIDNTVENNKEGYVKFFRMANGYTEKFFESTICHAYNLSQINNKEGLMTELVDVAKEFMETHKISLPNYKEYQMKIYMKNFMTEMERFPAFYAIDRYQITNKNLESYLLKNKLEKDLDNSNDIKSRKVKL